MKNTKKTSKFLSLVLRHRPERIGLELDASGWADVKELLKKANLDMETLEHVVETNNKKRFEFNDKKTKIRASQGHSVDVKLGYESRIPPSILYHGTAAKNDSSIQNNGLKKMNRHAVHLSDDFDTAMSVGSRHGKPLVYIVHAGEMYNDGIKFYLSNNGVWLTDYIDPKYLTSEY
jgi:putative RNA 2'-phosphotransferase